jgi:hypothetical protein
MCVFVAIDRALKKVINKSHIENSYFCVVSSIPCVPHFLSNFCFNICACITAQVVGRRPFTMEDGVQSRAIRGTYTGNCITRTGFSAGPSVFADMFFPLMLNIHISFILSRCCIILTTDKLIKSNTTDAIQS